ncbi:uncharacterized protein LOC133832483 [Humulus lupulus]|uniref:uncharacterized protein LOC133832483 n=1 Tax=Humulus lupulus TaxID=3486 RepID=UPI002B407CC7|nr:uncharacterized protein LOC133832483 [Humulus lupulus]
MEIADKLPQFISYLNERGQVMEQPIEYEWLPTKCSNCKKLGHTANSSSQDDAGPSDICWSVPKRTGNAKSTVLVPFEHSRNSYSVLQENQKIPNDLVLPTGLNGVLQHPELELRGLNRKNKHISVLDVYRLYKVGIGALIETKVKGDKIKEIMSSSFTDWMYYSSVCLEGRILLIWKAHLTQVDVIQENAQLFHCRVRICSRNQDFCLTIVYGSNSLESRRILWHDLAHLHLPIKSSIILGDFNATFDVNDRIRGIPISVKEMEDAQQWLAVGFFSMGEVVSDHNILLIKHVEVQRMGVKPFSYYNMWSSHDQFRETVLDSWSKPLCTEGSGLANKSKLYDDPSNMSLIYAEREAYLEFSRQEKIYESFLRQKSKITWLRFGDENSSYFHASLKKRKVSNRIVSFISVDGTIVDDYEMVTLHFLQHFQSFLGCASRSNGHIDPQSITFGPVFDLDTQLELIKPFPLHDVKVALFSIHSVKSPGPDGYGVGFFKDLRKDIGKEVSLAVLDFFETSKIPQSLNETLLVLIPKVDQPTNAADFRPIACYTTIYKCISKMLCGRLATFLPSLINQNQGAFIKHRSLAYNVLIFQDLIKGYNRKNSSPRCAMKIDLSKAYDFID